VAARAHYADQLSFLVRGPVKTLPQAAYRWVLDNPAVSLVLSGARNVSELRDTAAASTLPPFSAAEHAQAKAIHTHDFQAA
jgi:aryl-alcohol dehydrogenase-like predicted oxidoreductase